MRTFTVTEPATTGIGAALGWKAVGGAAGFAAGGAGLATIIVMLMTPPRTPREWTVGLISTVLGSICGGAAVVQHYSLQGWITGGYVGLVALMGIAFACGLPAWALVRWVFTWIIKRRDKDIGEVVADAKAMLP